MGGVLHGLIISSVWNPWGTTASGYEPDIHVLSNRPKILNGKFNGKCPSSHLHVSNTGNQILQTKTTDCMLFRSPGTQLKVDMNLGFSKMSYREFVSFDFPPRIPGITGIFSLIITECLDTFQGDSIY